MTDAPATPYDEMGGAAFFATLTQRFYEGVAADDQLRPMYPDDDLGPAEERLRMFLEQYWGGPGTYSELRGHPRLRRRHQPYRIDDTARERWLDSMRRALDHAAAEHGLEPGLEQELWQYLVSAAFAMTNASNEDTRSGLIMHEHPQ